MSETLLVLPSTRPAARSRRVAERVAPLAARIALAVIVLATLAIVADATAGPSALVPQSMFAFPGWEAGPLHALTTRVFLDRRTLGQAFTIALAIMLVAYLVVLGGLRAFTMREIAVAVVALHVILFLGPPLQLTDTFNYLGYAHLGALHHLDPYTHVMSDERLDPVFRFASWHDLRSPYGELFTLISYPLALMPLGVAYWVLKVATVTLSLGFVSLVWLCAQRLGRDARLAVAFVAFNPVFLIYELGGFHNDFFMLVPSMAAIALVLGRRDGAAGACLMVAIAVKFTAVVLGPFLLVALATRARCVRFVAGGLAALVPLLLASLIAFGTSLPNLQQQSTLLTDFSVPNLVGLITGAGGSPTIIKLCELAVVLFVVGWLALRRGRIQGSAGWMEGAGWATLALVLSLAWVIPWYVVWVLPLAGLVRAPGLRRASVLLTVYLMLSFVPVTTQYLDDHHINPLDTPAGHASQLLQNRLAN